MKLKATIFLSMLLLYSCGKCDKDVLLGEIQLAEASRQSIPYSGTEVLVFEDNHGVQHRLTSMKGRELLQSKMIVRTPCDEGFFDKQHLYYDTQREQIAFFDSSGIQIFYIDLVTQFEDAADLDDIAVYDFLLVDSSLKGNFNGRIEIITSERQNRVSDFHKNQFWNQSVALGDTTLFGRKFEDVYIGTSGDNRSIFYNKKKGILAFVLDENEFWVLTE